MPTPKPTETPKPASTEGTEESGNAPSTGDPILPKGLEVQTPVPRQAPRTVDIGYCRGLHMLLHQDEYWDYADECRLLIFKTAQDSCSLIVSSAADLSSISSEQQMCLKAEYSLVEDYSQRSKLGYHCLGVGLSTAEEYISCVSTGGASALQLASQWEQIFAMVYTSVSERDAVIKARNPVLTCMTQQQKELAADDVAGLPTLFWIDWLGSPDLRSRLQNLESPRLEKLRQRAAAVDACAEKTGYYEVFHSELLAEIRRLQEVDPASVEAITVFGWLDYFKESGYAVLKPQPDRF